MGLAGMASAQIAENSEVTWVSKSDKDITFNMVADMASEELTLSLGGYKQEKIDKITIMNDVGLSLKKWEALLSEEVTLDISELAFDNSYLIFLRTESGEILIEKFFKTTT